MQPIEELNFYDEKMLRLQYEISECFSHNLTKGEAREDFFKEYIKRKTGNTEILKGCICKGKENSSQLDVILCCDNPIRHQIGTHYMVQAEYCAHIIEIKSKLKNSHLKKLAKVSKKLKNMNSNIKVGMFAYCLEQSQSSIVKGFGYLYDRELDMYSYDPQYVLEENKSIDYVICIDENEEFVIVKENDKFELYIDKPIIKYLWPILRNKGELM